MAITITSEILCLGNELLLGTIVNGNAQWLSKAITEAGSVVKRITVAGDDVNEISSVIKEALSRKPDWLIISGGLGPTYDDKTLEGVAVALAVDLILDYTAVEMLKRSYARYSLSYELNDTRLKMARIPRGSIPIQNPIGSAPSVLIETNKTSSNVTSAIGANTKIICLPGVPKEMQAIFLESILPQIKRMVGDFHIIETTHETIGVSEAMLAPILLNIVQSNPSDLIYLKTHPQGYTNDNKPKLRIQIVSKGKGKSEVQSRYNNIVNTLIEEIKRLNGKVLIH